jgi:hypothetical protein
MGIVSFSPLPRLGTFLSSFVDAKPALVHWLREKTSGSHVSAVESGPQNARHATSLPVALRKPVSAFRLTRPASARMPVGRLNSSFNVASPLTKGQTVPTAHRLRLASSFTSKIAECAAKLETRTDSALANRRLVAANSPSMRAPAGVVPAKRPTEQVRVLASPAGGSNTVRLRVVHDNPTLAGGEVGRMVISGRMADVCAELDRLARREAQSQAPNVSRC